MSIKKIKQCLILSFIIISIHPKGYAQIGFNDARVMLQGFYWESYRHGHPGKFPQFGTQKWYEIVKQQAEVIRAGRFDLIWLPPPAYAGQYSAGYNPKEYFRLDNSYGSFEQHRAMLEALLEHGIEPVADIVINHRDGSNGWADFKNPQWGSWAICRSDEAFSHEKSEIFDTPLAQRGAEEERPQAYTDHGGTTYQYPSFRDLDHSNEIVQCDIINYLKQLKSMGYRGWRYDMVHGFHAKRLAEYNRATQPTFSVGEYDWDKDDEQRGWVWHSATTPGDLATASSVFDFRTHFILKDNKGNYAAWFGDMGKLGDKTEDHPWRNKAVTFLENHDTGYRTEEDGSPQTGHEQDSFANNWEVEQAYAYILTHPGVPMVFWKHYFNWGDELRNKIKALINARKVAGVTAGSAFYPQANAQANGVYAAHVVGTAGALYVRIGGDDDSWQPYFSNYHDYREYTSGKGWNVWVALPANPEAIQQAPLKEAFPLPGYETPVSCAMPPPQPFTIHYHRPDGNYDDWGLHLWGDAIDNSTDWDEPLLFTKQDDCGRSAVVEIQHPGEKLGFIVHKGNEKDTDGDRFFIPTREQAEIWLIQDDATIYPTQQPEVCVEPPPPLQQLIIHYYRPKGDYQGWGLHLWGDAVTHVTDWNQPIAFSGEDGCRRFATINIHPGKTLGFIIHKGDQKDIEANRYVIPTSEQPAIWLVENEATVYTTPQLITCKTPITVDLNAVEAPQHPGHVVLTAQTSCGSVVFYANANPIEEYPLETAHSMIWDTTPLSEGRYDLTAAVYDNSGTLSATSESVEVVIERDNHDEIDFREETIYFLLTARFYDGDPDNNYYNRDRLKMGDPHWRGDFKGLIEKLDYIKDLGFSAIWITPPVTNRSGLDYHGYHAYDWTEVDPRLESPEITYQDFIHAAHEKGLKVIQDVVINHSSNYGIRGQVWIDHLPIKYYRPQGGAAIDHGPYQGNLGNYKSVGKKVYEMKIDFGPGYRIYYMQKGDITIILLAGGTKSSQSRDIKKAQQIAAEIGGN